MQHLPFHLTESLLALLGKDVRNLLMETVFNVVVKVVELHAQLPCQHLADGGLSSPHIAYQDDTLH